MNMDLDSCICNPLFCRVESIAGVDTRDYPDFVDAYAETVFNTALDRYLTDEELEYFNENYSDVVQQAALQQLF